MPRKWIYSARITVDGVVYQLGRWRTRDEMDLARDRAALWFRVDRKLTFPEQARRLGPLSPEGLRHLVRQQVKATTASRYIGVYQKRGEDSFYALLRDDDENTLSLGIYDDEKKAAEAVDMAYRYYGRTPPNFPNKKLPARSPEAIRLVLKIARGGPRYHGVTARLRPIRPTCPWYFQVRLPTGKQTSVGGYKTDKLAARAYDRAVRYYKVDAPLNFPKEKLGAADIQTLRREVRDTRKARSSSKYRGVRWRDDRRRWAVYIRALGELHFVGEYKKEREAAKAYDDAARRILGRAKAKARLNFP